MDNNKIVEILMDMTGKISELHADVRALSADLQKHSESSKQMREEVDSLKRDANKAKGAFALLVFLIGLLFKFIV